MQNPAFFFTFSNTPTFYLTSMVNHYKSIVESGNCISDLDELKEAGVVELIGSSSHRKPHPRSNPVTTYILRGNFEFIGGPRLLFQENRHIAVNSREKYGNLAYIDNIHSALDSNHWHNEIKSFHAHDHNQEIEELPRMSLCNITTKWSQTNIYHAIYDAFAKLEVMSRLDFIEKFTYLVPTNANHLCDLLQEAGLSVLRYSSGKAYRGEMFVPSMPGALGNTHYSAYKFLKTRFAHIKSDTADRIIYITRRNSSKRKILNEEELLRMLKSKYSIELLELEKMTIAEQICSFKDAKCVIAPHGAGLSWIAFMSGGNVIELDSPFYSNGCFQSISRNNDLLTHSILRSRKPISYDGRSTQDYVVDIDDVMHKLDQML